MANTATSPVDVAAIPDPAQVDEAMWQRVKMRLLARLDQQVLLETLAKNLHFAGDDRGAVTLRVPSGGVKILAEGRRDVILALLQEEASHVREVKIVIRNTANRLAPSKPQMPTVRRRHGRVPKPVLNVDAALLWAKAQKTYAAKLCIGWPKGVLRLPMLRYMAWQAGVLHLAMEGMGDNLTLEAMDAKLLLECCRQQLPGTKQLSIRVQPLAGAKLLTVTDVTSASLGKLLRMQLRTQQPKKIWMQDVQIVVALNYKISLGDLTNRNLRQHAVSRVRQIAVYLCRRLTGAGYPDMGRQFGDMDHSTMHHCVQMVTKKVKHDPEFARDIANLTQQVQDY